MSRSTICLALAAATIAATQSAQAGVTYDTYVNSLNPTAYYRFETTGSSPNAATGSASAGITPLATYDFFAPGAPITNVFGQSSTLNPTNGFLGLPADNNSASFTTGNATGATSATGQLASNLSSTTAANSASYKTAITTALAATPAITISAWIKPQDLPASGTRTIAAGVVANTPADPAASTSAITAFQLNMQATGFHIGGRSKAADLFHAATFAYPAGFDTTIWHNVIGVLDYANKTVSIYLDGVQLGSATQPLNSSSGNTWSTSLAFGTGQGAGTLTVGAIYNGLATTQLGRTSSLNSQQFLGQIDELAIFNFTLTPQQLSGLYLAAVVPEPTTAALLSPLAFATLARRRR